MILFFSRGQVSVSLQHSGLIRGNLLLSSTTSIYLFYITSSWAESEVKGKVYLHLIINLDLFSQRVCCIVVAISFYVTFSRIVVAKPFCVLRFAFSIHMSLRCLRTVKGGKLNPLAKTGSHKQTSKSRKLDTISIS